MKCSSLHHLLLPFSVGLGVRQVTHANSALTFAWHMVGVQGLGTAVTPLEKMSLFHLYQIPHLDLLLLLF